MKKVLSIIMTVLILAISSGTIFTVSAADNLIKNPGFEENIGPEPAEWLKDGDIWASYSQSGYANSGDGSLAYWYSDTYNITTYQILTGLTNGTYTLSAYYVNFSGGQEVCKMYARNVDGSGEVKLDLLDATLDWDKPWVESYQQISLTFIVTDGQCEIGFTSVTKEGGQAFWVDDVSFTLVAAAVEATEAPALSEDVPSDVVIPPVEDTPAPIEGTPAPAAPAVPSAPRVGDSAIMFIVLATTFAGAFVVTKRVKDRV